MKVTRETIARIGRVSAAVEMFIAVMYAPDISTFYEERLAAIDRLKDILNEVPGQEAPRL